MFAQGNKDVRDAVEIMNTGKFGQGVKLKCCNCGEERSTGCGRCKLRKKAADIQNVRIMERVLNAEALQKVKQIQNGTMRPKEMA